MDSAFGVDHGDVSKSFAQTSRKLARVSNVAKPGQSMDERIKVNYVQWREKAAGMGRAVENSKKMYRDNPIQPAPPEVMARQQGSRDRNLASAKLKAKNNKLGAKAMADAAGNRGRRKGPGRLP